MKALFRSRIDMPTALEMTRGLAEGLAARGIEVVYDAGTGAALGAPGEPIASTDANVVVCVGGDGTILLAVQEMGRQRPLIGINCGEVGFLADLEPGDAMTALARIAEGFEVERRMRITLSLEGAPIGTALNEAVIMTSRPAKMLRFSVIYDDQPSERFRADGLLVATPTGSTAYAMSAGGPLVDPRIEGFLLVPLAPYMLSSRPHLISSDRTVEFALESAKPAHLVIDGQVQIELDPHARLRVERASDPALFIDVGRNFFEKVERKLRRL
ncbi:MAG: NAD(+)/NADH kinase [Methanospirillum sp.]|nr:NAD(+)/NADH kinase [Methanospirillum sp.]